MPELFHFKLLTGDRITGCYSLKKILNTENWNSREKIWLEPFSTVPPFHCDGFKNVCVCCLLRETFRVGNSYLHSEEQT